MNKRKSKQNVDVIIIFKETPSKKHIQSLKKHEAEIKYVYKYIPGVAARLPVEEIEKIAVYDWVKKVELERRVCAFPQH